MQQNHRSDIELLQVRALIQGQYATGKKSKLKKLDPDWLFAMALCGQGCSQFLSHMVDKLVTYTPTF